MRVLTVRELNRTTLRRQLLLRRARLPVVEAVERLGGLQAQWPPSPYVALWSRLEGFGHAALERAILRDALVKATLMRITLHLVSRRDFALFAAAMREPTLALWRRRLSRPEPSDALLERVRAFAAEAPRTRAELYAAFDGELGELPWTELAYLQAHAGLRHAPEGALWRPNQRVAYRTIDVDDASPEEALAHLARRYLAAFGPASRADLSQWSGLPLRQLDPALERLPLRRFRDEGGRALLDLPRLPLERADAPAPVRFLPRWDELLLAHADRRRVLPDEYRRVVIAKNGDVAQTFLVDGLVAGTWTVGRGRVRLKPFAPLPRDARRELEDEARRLEAFVGYGRKP